MAAFAKFLLVVGLVVSLGGCQTHWASPVTTAAPAPASAQPRQQASAVVAFVSTARPGQQGYVNDAAFGVSALVTFEREYYSASGQICRRFNVRASQQSPTESLVMCQEKNGWSVVRLPVLQ